MMATLNSSGLLLIMLNTHVFDLFWTQDNPEFMTHHHFKQLRSFPTLYTFSFIIIIIIIIIIRFKHTLCHSL